MFTTPPPPPHSCTVEPWVDISHAAIPLARRRGGKGAPPTGLTDGLIIAKLPMARAVELAYIYGTAHLRSRATGHYKKKCNLAL